MDKPGPQNQKLSARYYEARRLFQSG